MPIKAKKINIQYIMKIMKNCIIILTVFMCLSCSSKYSKKNHRVTFNLNDSLFIEKFKVFSGGTTTSDSYSYYITDSLHFRKYIGTEHYSDDQIFWDIKDYSDVKFYLAYTYLDKGAMKMIDYIDRTEKDPDKAYEKTSAIKAIVNDTTMIGNYRIQELIKGGKFE